MFKKSLVLLFFVLSCGQPFTPKEVETQALESSAIKVCGDINFRDRGFFIEEDSQSFFLIGSNQEVRDQLNSLQVKSDTHACIQISLLVVIVLTPIFLERVSTWSESNLTNKRTDWNQSFFNLKPCLPRLFLFYKVSVFSFPSIKIWRDKESINP